MTLFLSGNCKKKWPLLNKEYSKVTPRFRLSYVLRKQVLEKMIVDKLQRQLAEKAGINVSEEHAQQFGRRYSPKK